MSKIFAALVLFISVCFCSHAQSKKESIKTLFELMQQDSLMHKSFDAITSSIVTNMTAQFKGDTAIQSKMAAVFKKSMESSKKIAMKLLNEDMVEIYDKYFTQQEINDYIGFYKTKSGQKMIQTIPNIQKDIMAAMSAKYTPALQEEIMKGFDQIVKEASMQK